MKIQKKVIDKLCVVSGDDIHYTNDDIHISVISKGCFEIVIKKVDVVKTLKDVKV